MKFNCGENRGCKINRLEKWHDWFAWHPVTVGLNGSKDECRWLEVVERRGKLECGWGDCYWHWEYREKGGA